MLLMLLIGWIVLLPALVVTGLYVGSSVLGRRRATLGAYEDLFADEQGSDPASEAHVLEVTPEAITRSAAAPAASPADAPAPTVGAGY